MSVKWFRNYRSVVVFRADEGIDAEMVQDQIHSEITSYISGSYDPVEEIHFRSL